MLGDSINNMDDKLREVLEKKIDAVLAKTDEIKKIIASLDDLSTNTDTFSFGIVIGRLYNSFYYQCRRLLQRDPTEQEFSEFLEILKLRQSEIHKKFSK
jgi:phosphate uptake regulator